MKISVYGSALGGITPELRGLATVVGRYIAARGHTIITGACPGLPQEAQCGAYYAAPKIGKVIGFSPGVDVQDHVKRFGFPDKEFDELRFLPQEYRTREKGVCLKMRNVLSVEACDAAVFIAGRIGTMNEFTIAYDLGRNIGLLRGTGGFVDEAQDLVARLGKASPSAVVAYSSPSALIQALEEAQTRRT